MDCVLSHPIVCQFKAGVWKSEAERLRIVPESYQPGVSVSLVARRDDMNANLVFTRRRRYARASPRQATTIS